MSSHSDSSESCFSLVTEVCVFPHNIDLCDFKRIGHAVVIKHTSTIVSKPFYQTAVNHSINFHVAHFDVSTRAGNETMPLTTAWSTEIKRHYLISEMLDVKKCRS